MYCERESEGETDGALDGALDRAARERVGDEGPSYIDSSPKRLSGRGGYTVPFSVGLVLLVPWDLTDCGGDKGLSVVLAVGAREAALGD